MYYTPAILDMALTMQLAIFLEKIASLAPTPNSEWEFVCSHAEEYFKSFPGDVQTAVDDVGHLWYLFHRVRFHFIQPATAIIWLEGEYERKSR